MSTYCMHDTRATFATILAHLTDSATIQARHFQAGPDANLHIEPVIRTTRSGRRGWIHWRFVFMDYGMYHELSGKSRITVRQDGTVLVDNIRVCTLNHAVSLVFAGHYARFMRELRADLDMILAS